MERQPLSIRKFANDTVMAREYGIPAVINLAEATQQLPAGQRVSLHRQSGRNELVRNWKHDKALTQRAFPTPAVPLPVAVKLGARARQAQE